MTTTDDDGGYKTVITYTKKKFAHKKGEIIYSYLANTNMQVECLSTFIEIKCVTRSFLCKKEENFHRFAERLYITLEF